MLHRQAELYRNKNLHSARKGLDEESFIFHHTRHTFFLPYYGCWLLHYHFSKLIRCAVTALTLKPCATLLQILYIRTPLTIVQVLSEHPLTELHAICSEFQQKHFISMLGQATLSEWWTWSRPQTHRSWQNKKLQCYKGLRCS